jgi:hypothetical protein
MPTGYAHNIIPRKSPSRVLSTSTIVLFFLWLIRRRRSAYAPSCFARIIPLPSTTNIVRILQQTLEYAAETTPPVYIFDQSTIFDHSLIFVAGSLSVVTLRRAVPTLTPPRCHQQIMWVK